MYYTSSSSSSSSVTNIPSFPSFPSFVMCGRVSSISQRFSHESVNETIFFFIWDVLNSDWLYQVPLHRLIYNNNNNHILMISIYTILCFSQFHWRDQRQKFIRERERDKLLLYIRYYQNIESAQACSTVGCVYRIVFKCSVVAIQAENSNFPLENRLGKMSWKFKFCTQTYYGKRWIRVSAHLWTDDHMKWFYFGENFLASD